MSVTINAPAAITTLANVTGVEVEVRSPDGQLLGRFTPAPRPGMSFPEFGVSDEEMFRRLDDPNAKWVTGDEVVARLRSLRDAR